MEGKTRDLNHDLTFSAHTINCVCHSIIRSMFGVLGIYNFAFDIKFHEAQEQLNVSSSANNLVEQKVEILGRILDGKLEDMEEFINLVHIPESCGKLSLLGIKKSMESLIDPDGKGENNDPIKVSNFKYYIHLDHF